MNGKKERGRGDAATFESARQPTHFADPRKNAKYWNTTREDTTPRDGHVVVRFFRAKSRVVLSHRLSEMEHRFRCFSCSVL